MTKNEWYALPISARLAIAGGGQEQEVQGAGLSARNALAAGSGGGTRQGAAYWSDSFKASEVPSQWGAEHKISVGLDYATSPDLATYITGIRDDRFTRAEIDDARTAATAAERARIFAALEECRPTTTQYSRRDWALEERGANRLWEKIAAKLGMPVKEGE
jgi:hypothetical protein